MIIYGANTVKDLYKSNPSMIKKIYVDRKRHQSFHQELTNDKSIVLDEVKNFRFNEEVRSSDNHQGLLAEITDPKNYSISELIESTNDNKRPVLVMLDRIEDPQNFGAIIRSAVAFNVDGIIYPSRNSAKLGSTAMKTSAGTWQHMKFCEVSNLSNAVRELKKNNYWIISTSLQGNMSSEEMQNMDQPVVLLLGNEGKGVKQSLQQEADYNVKIDISEKAESLNVSVTAGILLNSLNKNVKKETKLNSDAGEQS